MKSTTAIELREVSLSYPKERNLSPSIKNIFSLKEKAIETNKPLCRTYR